LATARSSLAELDISQDHLKKLKSDKNEIELEIKTLQDKIQLNNKVIESLRNDDFKELRESLSKLKEEKAELDSEIQMLHREVGVYTERVSNSKEKVKGMEVSKKELMVKTDRSSYLSKLAKMFGKNGIQTILLNAVIEDLEKTSNKILHTICNEPFTILLETQRVGSDGISIIDTLDLVVSKDGVKQNFKSLSGGEQFRVSLALRIALSEISSRHGGSSLEFLLLDEVSSPLDRQGTETLFVNVIKSLEKKYKIMVITHNDTIKEKFDNVIDVSKIDGESQVNFVAR
jgi:exonuclease SbcC